MIFVEPIFSMSYFMYKCKTFLLKRILVKYIIFKIKVYSINILYFSIIVHQAFYLLLAVVMYQFPRL